MKHFGIWLDWDSIFVGTDSHKWLGVHLDLPWTDCCKDYGAPYRAYVHYWPGKCKSFNLPIPDHREDMWKFMPAGTGTHRILRPRCHVCKSEDTVGFASINGEFTYRNGLKFDAGSHGIVLCAAHASAFTKHKLRIKFEELP